MKRNLFFALVAFFVTSLFAQEKNLVKNGDFEDTSYVPFVYEDNVKRCPDLVAGWDAVNNRGEEGFKEKDFNNVGLTQFYVRGEIVNDSLADTGGKQCMRVQRYEWSGSEQGYQQGLDGGIQQTIEVAPNTKYTFSCMYRLSNRLNNNQTVKAFWEIYEGDESAVGTKVTRKTLYNEMDNKWYSVNNYSFTTKATTTRIRMTLGVVGGFVQTWGGNLGMFADYDNVSLLQADLSSVSDLNAENRDALFATTEGRNVTLEGVDSNVGVEVYNVAGAKVLSLMPGSATLTFALDAKGIYLIRNGAGRKPVKVAIQ